MITIFDVLCALARANDENRRLRNALAEALTTLDIEQWAYGVVLRDRAWLTAELDRKENALAERVYGIRQVLKGMEVFGLIQSYRIAETVGEDYIVYVSMPEGRTLDLKLNWKVEYSPY